MAIIRLTDNALGKQSVGMFPGVIEMRHRTICSKTGQLREAKQRERLGIHTLAYGQPRAEIDRRSLYHLLQDAPSESGMPQRGRLKDTAVQAVKRVRTRKTVRLTVAIQPLVNILEIEIHPVVNA